MHSGDSTAASAPDQEINQAKPTPAAGASLPDPFPVVGVGASAGGLEAFTQLLHCLPERPGVALVLVQHLDPRRESLLVNILSTTTSLPVQEIKQGVRVEQDNVYVIPPGTHLSISDGVFALRPREDHPAPNMPIDSFFQSLAEDMKTRAVGVILSGGGSDGTMGLEALKAAGGITFAQTESSATQTSMPRSAASSGCVDFILPVDEIARELPRLRSHPYIHLPSDPSEGPRTEVNGGHLTKLFALLRTHTGVDFTFYKRNTIERRIQRRMAVLGITDPEEFVRHIQNNPAVEAAALFQELLLRVTSFFRDPGAFDALQKIVFPAIVQELSPQDTIRIWVPGCSTGEEAYSIAIALLEHLGDMAANTQIKILATDINEAVLEKARAGSYLDNITRNVSPERLRRFFVKTGDRYQISKAVRDLCVFARHNLFSDPPFARMHLISCRNVLIYFDASIQQRILPFFHYGLRPNGFLLLGPSETIGTFTDLFNQIDRENCIYERTLTSRQERPTLPTYLHPLVLPNEAMPSASASDPVGLDIIHREADRVLSRFAPAGVVVDENLKILQFRGDTSPYLRNPPGTPSLELLRLAPDGLLADLREITLAARTAMGPIRREGIRINSDEAGRTTAIQMIPLMGGTHGARRYLILFEEQQRLNPSRNDPAREERPLVPPEKVDERLAQLQRELDSAREYLQSVIEEHEATNEELKSANEEILASNEELQSTNEELQTAKEEMQSTNEELETTNDELHHRNADLGQVNDDLTNLLTAAFIPLVMVNGDLHIRRFTAQAERLFDLLPGDVGRPIREIRSELTGPDLHLIIAGVIDSLTAVTLEVQDRSGHWYSMRVRPYRTLDNRIDGAVVTLIDIDSIKQIHAKLSEALNFEASILDTVQEALIVLDSQNRVQKVNRAFSRIFRLHSQQVQDQPFFDIVYGQLDVSLLEQLVNKVRGGAFSQETELKHLVPGQEERILGANVRLIRQDDSNQALVLVALEDRTDQRRSEQARREIETKMFQVQKLESLGVLAGGIAHDLNNLLTPILGYTELARTMLPPQTPAAQMLLEVEKATRKAADLVLQILGYAGKGRFVIQPVDLSSLVEEMKELLRTVVTKTVDLRFELLHEPPVVEVDATQIRQVVMNLVTNASEAIGQPGGVVTIRTGVTWADKETLRSPFLKEVPDPGSYVFLEVEDTGCGMDPATMEKIFDPFYSTKFTGRGLGLAAVQGIAHGHRGTIQVRSEPGQGSTFRLLLPTSVKQVQPAPSPPKMIEWQGKGTILVIEDEFAVREVANLCLKNAGLTVLAAADGLEGLAVFREQSDRINAVLLDLTLPGMQGLEVAKALHEIRPETPIILMSGYSVSEIKFQSEGNQISQLLQKPFSLASLLSAVRAVLEPRGPGTTAESDKAGRKEAGS